MVTFSLCPATRKRVLDQLEQVFGIKPLFWDTKSGGQGSDPDLLSRFQARWPGGEIQFFSAAADRALRDVASAIHEALHSEAVSWGTVANALRDQIDTAFAAPEEFDLDAALDSILRATGEQVVPRRVFVPILGLALPPARVIEGPEWRLSAFSEPEAQTICAALDPNTQFATHVRQELIDHFSGKACLVVSSCSDQHVAESKANEVARRAVAVLRFMACAHADGARHPQRPRIYAGPVRQHLAARTISVGGAGGPSIHRSFAGPSEEPYTPSPDALDQIENIGAATRLYALIGREPETALERALLQAVLWIGEAEDEDADASAFLKYWTAVEALVSPHASQHKSARLSTVLPIVLACGDVRWDDCTNIAVVSKAVRRSYNLRSKVVHQGAFAELRTADVREVCRWAYRVATNNAHLAGRGYSKTSQCEVEAQLIWEAHQGPPTLASPRLRTMRRPGVGQLWTALYSWMRTAAELRCADSMPRWSVEAELVRSLTRALAAAGARVTYRVPPSNQRRPLRRDTCSFQAKLDKHRFDFECVVARITLRTRGDVGRLVPRRRVTGTEPRPDAKWHRVLVRFALVECSPEFGIAAAGPALDSATNGALVWAPQNATRLEKHTGPPRSVRAGTLLVLDFDDCDERRQRTGIS